MKNITKIALIATSLVATSICLADASAFAITASKPLVTKTFSFENYSAKDIYYCDEANGKKQTQAVLLPSGNTAQISTDVPDSTKQPLVFDILSAQMGDDTYCGDEREHHGYPHDQFVFYKKYTDDVKGKWSFSNQSAFSYACGQAPMGYQTEMTCNYMMTDSGVLYIE